MKLAVDDFGTGYSSLAYLKKLPVDKLKIDRTFVTDIGSDPTSAAIVTAIIGLAHCLGLEVLAEGIQSDQQHATLLASGCTHGQGFLFSQPVSAAALAASARIKRRRPLRKTRRAAASGETRLATD